MIKKSFTISGHATSLKLEAAFWHCLVEMASERQLTLTGLITYEDCHRKSVNLASHLRVLALEWYQSRLNAVTVSPTGLPPK